ncbi:type II toxin-antitoxin system HicB family antitoxin [Xylocopilactobacillus apicola]|uniref:Uncharacterized protein n=1 Tax=Xylocopilactobacillus apicola TaxID=2932184 RepID=A0AAU9D7H1_9LACO|nr:type II toxin-antitoxin system HicB family antitoxin [Xylocopilactobacillus apicola]BDR59488.1 hypothetical protein XA3_19290 [Xylocopilactobacillus apicola]
MELTYPVIVSKFNDNGNYFVVTSPALTELKVTKRTMPDATFWAADEIATMLEGKEDYPAPGDPASWDLKNNDQVLYLTIEI